MKRLAHMGRVLVIAPHPDDEILGCGGTMARLAREGHEVHVGVVTTGRPPAFAEEGVRQVHREMQQAHDLIGCRQTHLLGLPAAALDTLPAAEVNRAIGDLVADTRPDTLLLPFIGDIHADHQITFLGAMVAARPRDDAAPARIMCYETLSETNWYAPPLTPAFCPNYFIDISETLQTKLDAFRLFKSQVRPFPDERSVESLEALARVRGSSVNLLAAEGFMMIRTIER